jgi:hypothetical protein
MSQLIVHNKCKYFGSNRCPHTNDDIMKQATQHIRESYGDKPATISFPSDQEIDEICAKCNMFT